MTQILKKLGFTISFSDLPSLAQRERIFWDRIPKKLIRKLLITVAHEQRIHPSKLQSKHLAQPIQFLHGKSLKKLYFYYVRNRKSEIDVMRFILNEHKLHQEIAYDEVVNKMKTNQMVSWDLVTAEAWAMLLNKVAEEKGMPVKQLTELILSEPFSFLGGHSLKRILDYAYYKKKKKCIVYILEKGGIETDLTLEDIFAKIQNGKNINWDRASSKTLRDIILKVADNKPPEFITGEDLRKRQAFLYGRSLKGLYAHYYEAKIDPEKDTISIILEKAGFQKKKSGRNRYRLKELERTFREICPDKIDTLDVNNDTQIISWLIAASNIYHQFDYEIPKEEIQSELYTFIQDYRPEGEFSPKTFLYQVHAYIESYVNTIISRKYKEKSLDTPIRGLGSFVDILEAPSSVTTYTVFSQKTHELLKKLSPLQRQLVLGITVEQQTFDELAEELQRKNRGERMDREMLQEEYDKALAILRGEAPSTLANPT